MGREVVDNAIIVQEIIHSMSRKKGRGGNMVIKIDLEKAYDRLEWCFIRDTLSLFKFPSHLINLIMSCVSSSLIAILFNGGALESFLPSKGIRQGDPLFPYLFILCMEVLGALIADKCNSKLWNPIKASRSGLAFCHLFYVDDLVILQEQIARIVWQLGRCWIYFAASLVKRLATRNPVSPQMWLLMPRQRCVTYWIFALLLHLGNILGS